MAGRGSRKTTFDKLQRERARREKQAAKRARRQGGVDRSSPTSLRPLEPTATKIDSDVNVLVLVHPKNLSPASRCASDQFAL